MERSTDLRTWTTDGIIQVDLNGAATGKGVPAGGGMERVLYETTGGASSVGGTQYLRVRARTKIENNQNFKNCYRFICLVLQLIQKSMLSV